MASIRQPIVSVLGHVDHGKTTLLDRIRGTGVAGREAGGITQHIGATEVPLAAIMKACGDLVKGKTFRIPGLLFIDTPGHVAFSTLRARGGALSDLAVLVIDVNEGFRPQTIESLNILKRYKTPFLVAANKIDLVPGWRKHEGKPFVVSYEDQPPSTRDELDRRMYELVGRLFEHGFSAERYDRVADFTTNIAVVPVSAKFGEGVPDLLLTLIGLAQRFLESQLAATEGPAFGTTGKPGTTKVKALLKPKPLDEIRDPQERFDSVLSVSAAAGVKILGSGLERAVAGAPLRAAKDDLADAIEEVAKESQVHIETQDDGILVKADAIGSLEGLAYESKQAGIPIKFARLGPVSRRDVTDAATVKNPLHRAILAFNLEILPDAKIALQEHDDIKLLESDIIYRLIEDYTAWRDERKRQLEEASRKEIAYPAKLLFLPDHIFRTSKPAIFGVRVLGGRIRTGESLVRKDGRTLGRIKAIRSGEKSLDGASAGQEVAISVDGVTIGRQIEPGDVLYVDLPEADARALRGRKDLNPDEVAVLEELATIKRKEDPFWGM